MVEEEVAQDRVEDARDVGARALWQQKALLLVHVQLVGLSVSARKRRGGERRAQLRLPHHLQRGLVATTTRIVRLNTRRKEEYRLGQQPLLDGIERDSSPPRNFVSFFLLLDRRWLIKGLKDWKEDGW